jgi:hypothetical protein
MQNDAKTKHDKDFADLCVESLRNFAMEAEVDRVFVNPDDAKLYTNTIGVILAHANDLEGHKARICHLCTIIDNIMIKCYDGDKWHIYRALTQIGESMHQWEMHFESTATAQVQCKTFQAIQSITQSFHHEMLSSIFDRYILSLAMAGREKVLEPYGKIDCTRRKPMVNDFTIQSISSPDFDMKEFLTRSPIVIFFGSLGAARYEITSVMDVFHSYIPYISSGLREWIQVRHRRAYGCVHTIEKIHNFPQSVREQARLVKKMYPGEELILPHLFIRPF